MKEVVDILEKADLKNDAKRVRAFRPREQEPGNPRADPGGGANPAACVLRRLARHGLRLRVYFGLMLDELLDLASQLGDLQPPQQDLLLHLDPHEDFPALAARGLKGLDALGVILQIGLLQNVDDLLHLLVHHLVEMLAHGTDLAVPGMLREIIVAELLQLQIEHLAHKLLGDVAGLLLDLLLLLQPLGRDGWRGLRRKGRAECGDDPQGNPSHKDRQNETGRRGRYGFAGPKKSLHCVSP